MSLEDLQLNEGQQTETFDKLRDVTGVDVDYEKFKLMCNYSNPHTNWSNEDINAMLQSPLQKALDQYPEYLDRLIAETEAKAKELRQKQQQKPKNGFKGLNPKLGYEESTLFPLELVSYIWVLIEYYPLHKNWHLLTATIINVVDQPVVGLKVIGCRLLQKLMLVPDIDLTKTGLINVFIASLKNNLYLSDTELFRLSFDILMKLNKEVEDSDQEMIELLNVLLMMIDKHFNRYGKSQSALGEHLKLLSQMVEDLDVRILVSLNRVNFLLNQLMTNSSILELHTDLVPGILQIQNKIIQTFNKDIGKEGKWLLYDYRFDILGAWKITVARLKKLDKHVDLLANINQFKQLISDLNQDFELVV